MAYEIIFHLPIYDSVCSSHNIYEYLVLLFVYTLICSVHAKITLILESTMLRMTIFDLF